MTAPPRRYITFTSLSDVATRMVVRCLGPIPRVQAARGWVCQMAVRTCRSGFSPIPSARLHDPGMRWLPQPAGGILPHGVGQLWNRQSHCCTAPSGTSLGRGDSTRLVEKQQPRVAAGVALGGRWSRFLAPGTQLSERPVFKCPASDFAHNLPALSKFSSTVYISVSDVHDLGEGVG